MSGQDPAVPRINFTPRQNQILSLVAAGLSDKEIAGRTGLKPRSVSKHLERLYRKLELPNRTALAIVWAKQQGRTILSQPPGTPKEIAHEVDVANSRRLP